VSPSLAILPNVNDSDLRALEWMAGIAGLLNLVLAACSVVAAERSATAGKRSADASESAARAAKQSAAAADKSVQIALDALEATKSAAEAQRRSVELYAAVESRERQAEDREASAAAAYTMIEVEKVLGSLERVWNSRSRPAGDFRDLAYQRLQEAAQFLLGAARSEVAMRLGGDVVIQMSDAARNVSILASACVQLDMERVPKHVEKYLPKLFHETHALHNLLRVPMHRDPLSWDDMLSGVGIAPSEIPDPPSPSL